MDNSLIVEDVNIANFSDEELLERLLNFGFNPGPILDSTRGVYQRKLARLMRNEEFSISEEEAAENEEHFQEINSSYSSTSGSPYNTEELRRRPLARVSGERWMEEPTLASEKIWSPSDIVTQAEPPPDEEEKPLLSPAAKICVVVGLLLFFFLVYYNMESSPQTPFS